MKCTGALLLAALVFLLTSCSGGHPADLVYTWNSTWIWGGAFGGEHQQMTLAADGTGFLGSKETWRLGRGAISWSAGWGKLKIKSDLSGATSEYKYEIQPNGLFGKKLTLHATGGVPSEGSVTQQGVMAQLILSSAGTLVMESGSSPEQQEAFRREQESPERKENIRQLNRIAEEMNERQQQQAQKAKDSTQGK